jgi:ABC-type uncharacterized transport system permease subunit
MFLSYFAIIAYLLAALLLMRFFTQDNAQHKHQKSVFLLFSFAVITHALSFTNFWTANGVFFGLANSTSFAAWLITTSSGNGGRFARCG